MNQHERTLVKKLREKLAYKFDKIYIHKKPSASEPFRNYVRDQLGYIPILQPELDMVFRENSGELNAVEVKSFTPSEFGYGMCFYEGIGQALALQRYGFDHVALWHFISDGILKEVINRYGPETWSFIRKDLCMPLDFSYICIGTVNDVSRFHVMQYSARQNGFELLEIDNPRFQIRWRHPNPIKDLETQKVIRSSLNLWLDGKITHASSR
jgi:hypothetical protein